MGKKQAGENSKKAAVNAKKAEAAAQKASTDNAKKAAVEDVEWSKGAKSSAKKEAADAKALDLSRKKAEKEALLAADEKTLASARATPKNSKTATKKTSATAPPPKRGLDLAQLSDDDEPTPSSSLNATGIDNALDALSLADASNNNKVDRHPERRFKAAYAAFEARRLPEVEAEYVGLRKQQRVEIVRREFERSAENPFNQLSARFDTGKGEMREMREREREEVERRLGG